jgi:hypothetical protein
MGRCYKNSQRCAEKYTNISSGSSRVGPGLDSEKALKKSRCAKPVDGTQDSPDKRVSVRQIMLFGIHDRLAGRQAPQATGQISVKRKRGVVEDTARYGHSQLHTPPSSLGQTTPGIGEEVESQPKESPYQLGPHLGNQRVDGLQRT